MFYVDLPENSGTEVAVQAALGNIEQVVGISPGVEV